MYSKDRGVTHDTPQPLPRRQPMYRQPERPRMQVPPNYSGHAIVDGEERPLGRMAEAPDEAPPRDLPTPHFDDLPRVSDLGDNRRRPPVLTVPATFEEPDGEGEDPDGAVEEVSDDMFDTFDTFDTSDTSKTLPVHPSAPASASASASAAPAVPASGRWSLFDLSRFPFGHGIGMEELLIIGLILFLLHENASCEERGDIDETVILLGLLLILG